MKSCQVCASCTCKHSASFLSGPAVPPAGLPPHSSADAAAAPPAGRPAAPSLCCAPSWESLASTMSARAWRLQGGDHGGQKVVRSKLASALPLSSSLAGAAPHEGRNLVACLSHSLSPSLPPLTGWAGQMCRTQSPPQRRPRRERCGCPQPRPAAGGRHLGPAWRHAWGPVEKAWGVALLDTVMIGCRRRCGASRGGRQRAAAVAACPTRRPAQLLWPPSHTPQARLHRSGGCLLRAAKPKLNHAVCQAV